MIRRINYTDKIKIKREEIIIKLHRDTKEQLYFTADFKFDSKGIPSESKIFVEAYCNNIFKRFSFGTYANPRPPSDCFLIDFGEEGILFRIKIVDSTSDFGKILADISHLQPETTSSGEKISLLPVELDEQLGETIWRVDFSDDRPILRLNAGVAGIKDNLLKNPSLFSIILPAVVYEILMYLIFSGDYDYEAIDNTFYDNWIRFARNYNPQNIPPKESSNEEKLLWIHETMDAFSKKHEFKNKYISITDEDKQ